MVSLRKTLQDVIAQAELVVSLAAVDALQGDLHQLLRVPDHLLLALDDTHTHTVRSVLGCVYVCVHLCEQPKEPPLSASLWDHK